MTSTEILSPYFVLLALGTLVGFGWLFVAGVRRAPALAFGLLMLYEVVSKQMSVAFLDTHEIFITESGTVSGPTGAYWRFLVANLVMIFAAYATISVCDRVHSRTLPGVQRIPALSSFLALTLLGIVMLLQVTNLGLSDALALPGGGATRWSYWQESSAFPFLRTVFGVLMAFTPFVAGTIAFGGPQVTWARPFAIIVLLAYALYLAATGQRFHGFLVPGGILYGVYIARMRAWSGGVVPLRALGLGLLGILVLLAYSFIEFGNREISVSLGGPLLGMLYRIFVLQGHSYWNADALYLAEGAQGSLPDLFSGLSYLMSEVGTAGTVEEFAREGINFAVALPASSILVAGFLGMLAIMAVYGMVLGVVYWWVHTSVRAGSVLALFPLSYIWLWVHAVYTKASFETVLSNALFIPFVVLGIVAMHPNQRADSLNAIPGPGK